MWVKDYDQLWRERINEEERAMNTRTPALHCLRCGWQWFPRQADVRICPKCKSARWDTAKESKS